MACLTFTDFGRIGRLGNQLFHFAATIGVARKHKFDPIFRNDWLYRPYFNVPDEMYIPPEDLFIARDVREFVNYPTQAQNYLQDWNLFHDQLDEIREYLRPSVSARDFLPEVRLEHPILAVHVRRGDNVFDAAVPNKSHYHYCPSLAYYNTAIAMFPDAKSLYVFTDDLPWCEAHFQADAFGNGLAHPKEHEPDYLIRQPLDWVDLYLMSKCDHFVVTGSTFGIWGAFLANVAPDHVVRISDDQVYGPGLAEIDASLLFDPDWISLYVA